MTWNPEQYHLFRRQRLRPAQDLLAATFAAVSAEPKRIVDLGCGGGFLASQMAERWPSAQVTGLDGSAEMLVEAQARTSSVAWVRADISTWRPDEPLDIIISNAALHWIDNHAQLFPQLLTWLAPGGVLATQMPRNFAAPSHTLLADTIRDGAWATRLARHLRPAPVSSPADYVEWLYPNAVDLDLWETEYLHRLSGENPVLEWVRGTALAPVLKHLSSVEAEAFVADYSARLRSAYPPCSDGVTLFPFRRLFIIARV
ncbi:Trans-aconitate 2-methyltransferase [Azospirillaceae bacterium]